MNKVLRDEIRIKEARVREFLKRNRWQGILLSRQDNFSWITAGGDSHVAITSERGSASCLITDGGKFLITSNIESKRIMSEEVKNQGFILREYSWQDEKKIAIALRLTGRGILVSDYGSGGLRNVNTEFSRLRYSLLDPEVRRYRRLGRMAGTAVGEICRSIKSGERENQVAGRLAEELQGQGIIPAVILVAADERINRYRHPVPTDKKIKKRAMVVVCARRWGLIASLTRLVHFGRVSPALRKKHLAVTGVDAAFISLTRPEAVVGEIFTAGLEVYEETGFGNEWQLHHQGGPTGYASRDYKAVATEKRMVELNQAFAWNPSVTGTKSEDTIIALDRRTEVITATPSWPMIPVTYHDRLIQRPDILKL